MVLATHIYTCVYSFWNGVKCPAHWCPQEVSTVAVASVLWWLNLTCILYLQTLISGEEGKEVSIGRSDEHRHLNRFRNITACEFNTSYSFLSYNCHDFLCALDDDCRISLEKIPNFPACQHDYINASYVDVSWCYMFAVHTSLSLSSYQWVLFPQGFSQPKMYIASQGIW